MPARGTWVSCHRSWAIFSSGGSAGFEVGRSGHRWDRHGPGREHDVDIQQDLDATLRLGDSKNEAGLDPRAEGRSIFDVGGADVQHLRDGIHKDAHDDGLIVALYI